jgi:glycine cleavage system H protein
MPERSELGFTSEHEWVFIEGAVATVGITAYAAAQLGDIVYLDLPQAGRTIEKGAVVGEIESTKSVGELFAPVEGTVVEANARAADSPELVNDDPYGAGWLIKVEFSALPPLLTAAEYDALVES